MPQHPDAAPPEPAATPDGTGADDATGAPTATGRTRATATVRAPLVASAVALLLALALALVLGSRMLRGFGSALLPYAVATALLAVGVAYRHTVRGSEPPARRLLRQGLHTRFCREKFRTAPVAPPQLAATYLDFRKLLGAPGTARWAAHQLAFWGCLLAALITFPLTLGGFAFAASTGAGPGYAMRLRGLEILGFPSSDAVGRALFHGLDRAAVLVIAGAGYFLWCRLRGRTAGTGQRFASGLVPLLASIVVSGSGTR